MKENATIEAERIEANEELYLVDSNDDDDDDDDVYIYQDDDNHNS